MKNPLIKVGLKYGLIGSIISLIPFFVLLYNDKFSVSSVSYIFTGVFLLGIFIFFAQQEFKKYYNKGLLHFWQGMTISFIVYLFVAIVNSTVVWTVINQQDEVFLHKQIERRIERSIQTKANSPEMIKEEDLEESKEILQAMTLPDLAKDTATKAFWVNLFFGMILSPILTLALRKTPH